MVANILWVFLGVSAFAGIFFLLYGMVIFFLPIIRPGKPPIDKSNMWNRLIGPFYVARYPEVFGGIEFWKNDLGENIDLVAEAVKTRNDKNKTQAVFDAQLISEQELLDLIDSSKLGGFPIKIDSSLDDDQIIFVMRSYDRTNCD